MNNLKIDWFRYSINITKSHFNRLRTSYEAYILAKHTINQINSNNEQPKRKHPITQGNYLRRISPTIINPTTKTHQSYPCINVSKRKAILYNVCSIRTTHQHPNHIIILQV